MKIKPHQIQQFANQENKIKAAGKRAKVDLLFPVYSGTFYSERFQK